MSYQDWKEDKIYKHQPIQEGESDCCGAPVLVDMMLCSVCYDNCDFAPKLCGYCGDVEVEEDEQFCCDDCWRGYASETFYNDKD